MSGVYNAYEALVNGIVGAIYLAVRTHRQSGREMLMYGLEKGIINVIASYLSLYVVSSSVDALDIEYLTSAILAALYHSHRKAEAAGDQLLVSIIAHLISNMSSSSSAFSWFQRNLYGTPAAGSSNREGANTGLGSGGG